MTLIKHYRSKTPTVFGSTGEIIDLPSLLVSSMCFIYKIMFSSFEQFPSKLARHLDKMKFDLK